MPTEKQLRYWKSMKGEGNPFFNKKHSYTTKKKMKDAKIGLPSWNKGIKGKESHAFKSGKTYDNGYIYVSFSEHPSVSKKGYVAEHRLIMEKKLGRYLDSKEEIHHIDFNRSNNKINNLRLFKNKSEHIKLHNDVRFKK